MFKPTQFGKYYLTERIAVGGMAELFRATLYGISGFEKSMVVKQILPKYSKNNDFIQMFINEAKIAVTLTHGNIVPVYELGRQDEVYFIAMEYIHGRDLADILETARARGLPLSAEHAAYICIEICKGLEYAHRRTDTDGRPLKVVHRDISPPNILISFDGEVKIADFGIAKAAHRLGSTEAGVVKGTFGYMSPEQVRGLPLDHRTDIFSAGILLHEMLTGRRLFTGDSDIEAIERVKAARVPSPSSVNPRVPAAVDPIVFKALARDPSDRFADANEFQLALSRFLFTAGKGATASTLSRYVRELFADELKKEQLRERDRLPRFGEQDEDERTDRGGRPISDRMGDSQSFAVSPELDRAARALESVRPRQVMDAGAGAPAAGNATLALPSLFEGVGGPGFEEEELTQLYKGGRAPARPEVPELKFPPKESRPGGVPAVLFPSDSQPEVKGMPSGEELGRLADQLDGTARPGKPRTAPPGRPQTGSKRSTERPTTVERPITADPSRPALDMGALLAEPTDPDQAGGDAGLMNLLAQQSGGQPLVGDPHMGEERPTVAGTPSGVLPRQTGLRAAFPDKKAPKGSGIFSATMRLFVEGFDEDDGPSSPSATGQHGSLPGRPGTAELASLTGDLEIPRTIKPTVLGWILIGLVVLAAGSFVVYKKTSLFGHGGGEDSGDLLKPEDIRKGELTRPAIRGSIKLSTALEEAHFFLFSGETPTTLTLDSGKRHLLRIERDGFQTVHRQIEPSQLGGEVKISLQPSGAGAKDLVFDFKESGSTTGRNGTIKVVSEPPVAMVWLFAGKGEMELQGLDTSKSFNFKVVAPRHQPLLLNVAPADFDKSTGEYSTSVSLEPEGAAEDPGSGEPKTPSGVEPVPKPEPTPKVTPKVEPKIKVVPKVKVAPKVKAEPKIQVSEPKKVSRPKKTPVKKPAIKGPEPKTKTKIPDWAR